MASTIKIKRSSVAGKKPTTSEITTGELALNTKDRKLFSSNGTSVFELANAGALANTNAYIATKANNVGAADQILYRNSSNVLTSSSNLRYDGTNFKVNGNIESLYSSGDEGGELFLNKPVTSTSIVSGVRIDVYQNKLRFWEDGGTNRGAYIDITAAGAGVGTNLLTGGGGSTTQYLQVANAVATYQTKAVERAALANTNASIATQATRITLVNTNLTGTNTALRTLINARLQVANATTLLAAKASWTGLTSTNTALRTLISDRLQVANASTLYTTKSNPATSGLLAHTGRATISTNLYVAGNTILGNPAVVTDRTVINGVTVANGQLSVTGNTVLNGTLVANSTAGISGYYLRTSGTGVYWSPVSGGGANGFSGILVGANVISADSTTDRLTFVAGSGITLAANPTTDTITISTTSGAAANVVTKIVKDLTQNDTVVTSVSGVVVGSGITTGKAIAMAIVFGG